MIGVIIGIMLGLLVLALGLQRTSQYRRPAKWVLGIITLALNCALWPPLWLYLAQPQYAGGGLVAVFGMMFTVGWSLRQLSRANKQPRGIWLVDLFR